MASRVYRIECRERVDAVVGAEGDQAGHSDPGIIPQHDST